MNINLDNIIVLAKKYWKFAAIGLAVLLAVILLIPKGNTYKTPIKLQAAMMNAKTADKMLDKTVDMLNGLGQDQVEDIVKILEKTEDFDSTKDMMVLALGSIRENAGEK